MAEFIQFPEDFVWGVATASYQIEGAVDEDGRGPSIWDTFSATPGKVKHGDTGAVACDHYHRYREDIALMRDSLGVDAYRFSIAWPRVLPEGRGQVNETGLDFYERLVDSLLEAGITPWVTLYHWDLPQALQDAGGWPSRDIVAAYRDYVDVVTSRLGDRIRHWMTFNEPWVFTYLGYAAGIHAPGHKNFSEFLQGTHHMLLAHADAEPVIRRNAGDNAQVGLVLNLLWADPATEATEDQIAVERQMGFQNRWFLDPVYRGQYPGDMVQLYEQARVMPKIDTDEISRVQGKPDFLGVNFYTREVIQHDPDGMPVLQTSQVDQAGEHTTMGWEVAPESLYNVLTWVNTHYDPGSIYITENGAAFPDTVTEDGAVHDPRRTTYYQQYLASAHRAMTDGVPLRGYFAWSLMDNFEWAEGYEQRFGIIYVDYNTQQRILKDTAHWYSRVIAQNGFTPE